jgi:hypothetical protein
MLKFNLVNNSFEELRYILSNVKQITVIKISE